jgi:hypothetical protein
VAAYGGGTPGAYVHLRDPLVASLVIPASSHHLSTRVLVTFSGTSTDEPLISGGTSGVTQVNGLALR